MKCSFTTARGLVLCSDIKNQIAAILACNDKHITLHFMDVQQQRDGYMDFEVYSNEMKYPPPTIQNASSPTNTRSTPVTNAYRQTRLLSILGKPLGISLVISTTNYKISMPSYQSLRITPSMSLTQF